MVENNQEESKVKEGPTEEDILGQMSMSFGGNNPVTQEKL